MESTDNIFKGVLTALITPFDGKKIDFKSLEKLIEYQIEGGVDGIIIAGSTGEGLSLTIEEYELLLSTAVGIAADRISVIASCSTSSTNIAIEMSLISQKVGADGFMATTPPYVKPTQAGIYEHFKLIHDSIDLPIMLYAIKSRTGIDIEDDTILNLAKLPNIMALKDSCANLTRPLRLSAQIKDEFNILAGDDPLALAFNAQGAKGCVSVASNVVPKICKEVQDYWNKGDVQTALKIQQKLLSLYKSLFIEPNPIGIKYAAHRLGLCKNELRLPLIPCGQDTKVQINNAIESLNG